MPLSTGAKLGTYEITSHLGSGGMGEVEAFCGREASLFEAGSPQPKSRAERGISLNA
jgi:hypothetical protein